jgi:hypothetical protein
MTDVVVAGSADMLTVGSRKFYERAKLKAFLSIVYAATALFFLGLCCQSKETINAINTSLIIM